MLGHQAADRFHHLFVGALTRAAVIASTTNAIALPQPPPSVRQQQSLYVIFHIKPIAHVCTVSVEGNRFASHRLENHPRNQLLRKLSGSVVVGAVGKHHRHPVGLVSSAHKMAACRLAGGIGGTGVVGCSFRKGTRGPQGTKYPTSL